MSNYNIDKAVAKRLAEVAFEASLREYAIDNTNRKFQFGGAHNLISTVQTVFEKLAEEFNCTDYKVVAAALDDVLAVSDLPYRHEAEEDDRRLDAFDRAAAQADLLNDERKCNGLAATP